MAQSESFVEQMLDEIRNGSTVEIVTENGRICTASGSGMVMVCQDGSEQNMDLHPTDERFRELLANAQEAFIVNTG